MILMILEGFRCEIISRSEFSISTDYEFLPLENNHKITPIIPTATMIPHHIPALKIVSMASQLVRSIKPNRDINKKLSFFIIIYF